MGVLKNGATEFPKEELRAFRWSPQASAVSGWLGGGGVVLVKRSNKSTTQSATFENNSQPSSSQENILVLDI